jgi:hypothetical protein
VSAYSAAVLALSPKRYYRLGETSGTVANDLGSDAQNGTIQAAGTGVTLNQASLILSDAANASMLFTPASAGYITLPTTSLPTGAGAWSVAAWVKMPATLPASGTFNTVWNFGNKSTNQFVELFYRGSISHFEVDDWSGAVVTATSSPVGGGTYFLVVTYDGTTCNLYINGALNVSAAKTFNIVLTAAQIGNDQNADYWSGNIDEVAWFGSALTLAQIQSMYNAATTAALSATLAGVDTLSGPLQASLALPASTLAGAATLAGTLTTTASVALAGTLAGTSTLSGTGQLATSLASTCAGRGTLTLPLLAQDTFAGRSVTGSSTVSFGTASDGSAWGAPLSGVFNTVFGVASGEGFMYYDNLSGSSANGLAFLGSVALRDVDLTCRFKFGSVSGNPKFVLYVRGTNINNLTDVTINATTGAVVLERWSPGNNTTFAMGTFGALTAGSYYHLRIQSDGTTFRAKVWADGSSEPGSFPYTATDSFPARLVAGFFGVGVEGVTATTQATGVQFDNVVASLLYLNQQLYVATTGSDSTGTGASAAPFATIQHGLDAISPGGTLHVAPGTYAQASGVQLTCVASGNAANRITLVSDVKWGAKITGTNSFTIFEVDGSYVDVLQFEVSATDTICSYGVVMQGNFVSVQRCFVHDIFAVNAGTLGGAGISGQNSGNNYLSGPVDVIGNFVTRIGVDDTSVNSPYVHSIYMSNQGGNVQNNIVVGNVANAFQGGHGFSNMNVSNNTFVGNTAGGVFIWNAGPGVATGVDDFTTIANNIIAYNTGVVNYAPVYGLWEYGVTAGINGPHNTYTNNLLFGNAVVPSGPYAGLQYEFDNTGVLVNSLFVDPQMINYQQDGSGDYHLKPNSPAINAGVATNAPTTDYDGLTRPLLGANIDIGAYEATAVVTFIPRALSALLMLSAAPLAGTLTGAGQFSGSLSSSLTALTGTLAGTSTLAGPLTASFSLSTTNLPGSSTLAGNATLTTLLTGGISGSGTLAGTLAASRALTVTIVGTGQLAGSLIASIALGSSTLAGTGILTGTLGVGTALSATIAGTGQLAGSIAGGGALATTMAGTSALSGLLSAAFTLSGTTLAGTASLAGGLSAAFTLTGTTTAGSGTLSGTVQLTTALTVTAAGITALSGGLSANLQLTSITTPGSGTLSGTMLLRTFLADTLSGMGTLAGAISASFTLSGATLVGAGTLAGTESLGTSLSVTLAGSGVLTGATPTLKTALASTLSGAGQLTGSIAGGGALAVTLAGTSSVGGVFSLTTALIGSTAGTGILMGALSARVAFTSTLGGAGSVTTTSSLGVSWTGVLVGAGTLSGTSVLATYLLMLVPGSSGLSGTVTRTAVMTVVYTGSAQLSAALILGGGQLSMCLFAARGTLAVVFSFPGPSATATWKTRDLSTTWKTRDLVATWVARDDEVTWKGGR